MSNSNNINESGSRLDEARKNLVDLLRAFGELNIRLGKDYGTKTGNIHSSVNSYVKQQMDQVRMPFPFDEAKKKNKRIINKSLGRDHLCVIINEALMEYMEAYLDEMGDVDHDVKRNEKTVFKWIADKQQWLDEMFPNFTGDELIPFLEVEGKSKKKEPVELDPQNVKLYASLLSDMGYDSIDDMSTMKELFWDLAMRHTEIGVHMKSAIESITTNDLARNYLNSHLAQFNKLMKRRLEDPKLQIEEQGLRKLYGRGYQSYLQHVAKIKKECEEEIRDIKRSSGRNNKVAKNLKILLENPKSNLMDCYDLTDEVSIKQYLSWYRIWVRPIKQWVVRALEEQRYPEPGALDLFKQKVEEHNAIIEKISERITEEKIEGE